MHLSDLSLRAYLDNELNASEAARVNEHLADCVECASKLDSLKTRMDQMRKHLNILAPVATELPGDATSLLLSGRRKIYEREARSTDWRRFGIAAAVIAFVALALSYEPVRTWAGEFLAFFRVQQIHVVQIDPANLERFQKDFFNSETRPRIEQLFSENAVVTGQGKSKDVATVADAAKVAGFGVRLPGMLQAQPRLKVQPGVSVTYTIDLARVQGILDEAGRKDIRLPQELDGETVYFHIPAGVTAAYGKCPEPDSGSNREERRRRREFFPECKIVAQLPSPTIAAPTTLPAAQLGEAFLQLLGMTPDQARDFSETINWTSTLVLPLPIDDRTKYSKVTVDGVTAALITAKRYHPVETDAYTLFWVKDGILYSLLGFGKPGEALAIADSMR